MKYRYIYPAIFESDVDNRYSVSFPDLPGCFTEGDTLDDAYKMAQDALKLHLFSLEKDGEVIPPPTLPSDIKIPEEGFMSLVDVWMQAIRRSNQLK
jgi:predicted RNase H-like HicB family nuclease